jgi:hypothetical protein
MIAALRGLGLRPYTLRRSWAGINTEEVRLERGMWGLKPVDKDGEPGALVIPPGLIIPRFNGAALETIAVRPVFDTAGTPPSPQRLAAASTDGGGDTLVEGSRGVAMALGSGEGKPFVRVADELEAILLHQELGDFCAVIAMKDPSVDVDKETAGTVQKAPQFLVVVYSNEKAGRDTLDLAPWKKLCPGRKPFPCRAAGTSSRRNGTAPTSGSGLPAPLSPASPRRRRRNRRTWT